MEMEEWASSFGTNRRFFFVFATQYPKHEQQDHCPKTKWPSPEAVYSFGSPAE
jgi:hypothetical protein